jgi:hypothetical protein
MKGPFDGILRGSDGLETVRRGTGQGPGNCSLTIARHAFQSRLALRQAPPTTPNARATRAPRARAAAITSDLLFLTITT